MTRSASVLQAMHLKRRLQSTLPSPIAMQAMRPEVLAVASDGLATGPERL